MTKKKGFFSGSAKIFKISIGLVYLLFILWLIFHTFQYVPEGQQDTWNRVFIAYAILNVLIIGSSDTRNKLFSVELLKFVPRFLIFFSISIIVFYFIINWADPMGTSILSTLKNVPLWLGFIHAFVFSTTESVVWQGYLDEKIGVPASALTAGIFHSGIWAGDKFIVIISAGLLFLLFSYIHYRFSKNKNDLAPVIGAHAAFNFVKIGLSVFVLSV